jgi:pyrroline-5-carboxylate reductase
MLESKQIGFIGGGAMAEALIRGMLSAKQVTAEQITVSDVTQERLSYLAANLGVATSLDSQEVADKAQILFLTVKPQTINVVLDIIAPVVAKTLR